MSPAPKVAEKAYSITEAAELKGVSPDTIRRAIRAGELAAKKVGRGYRASASAIESWWNGLEDA